MNETTESIESRVRESGFGKIYRYWNLLRERHGSNPTLEQQSEVAAQVISEMDLGVMGAQAEWTKWKNRDTV